MNFQQKEQLKLLLIGVLAIIIIIVIAKCNGTIP